MNNINILCIDGVTGTGKTRQIGLYRNLLKLQNTDFKIFNLTEVEDPKDTKTKLLEIAKYCRENPNSVALCDGSIATDIVDDMVDNMLYEEIWSKHQENLQVYTSMNQEFNIVNILLSPMDIQMCYDRVEKKQAIFGEGSKDIKNYENLRKTANILKSFDNSVLTTNIRFYNVNVSPEDSMLDVHNNILKAIKDN